VPLNTKREAAVTAVDLPVLVPWLIFGAGLGLIGYRLLSRHGTGRQHRDDGR
jgi:hypothetical protein